MRKESVGVTEALLKQAQHEFLQYGFRDASLRRISADSGVSTNSIYTRFQDKAGLFKALVKPAADGLMEIYQDSISGAADSKEVAGAFRCGDQGTEDVLKYVYEHFLEFKLIFCHSQGTEYEHFLDELAQKEEAFYRSFAKQYATSKAQINDFFIHVVCRMGWQYVYEVVSHDLTYEEAKAFMENIRQYSFAGWKSVLGIESLDL